MTSLRGTVRTFIEVKSIPIITYKDILEFQEFKHVDHAFDILFLLVKENSKEKKLNEGNEKNGNEMLSNT